MVYPPSRAAKTAQRPCMYFMNAKCFKGDMCPFFHDEKGKEVNKKPMSNLHMNLGKQKYKDHHKYERRHSPKRYSRSPRRYSRSPRRYSRSPRRYSRSPRRYSRSPIRYSHSPRRYSRSPMRQSQTPMRYSQSPMEYSPGTGRYSPNLRRYSPNSYKYRSGQYRGTSKESHKKPEWMQGNSPMPPPDKVLSPDIKDEFQDTDGTKLLNPDIYGDLEPSSNKNLSPFSEEDPLAGNLICDPIIDSAHTSTESKLNLDGLKQLSGEFSCIQNIGENAQMDFSPSKALDMIKNLPVDFFNYPLKNNDGLKVKELDEKILIKIPKPMDPEFMPPRVKKETMLPPVMPHENETFRPNPLAHHLFPINNDPPQRRDDLWTPAMDRNKVTKAYNQPMLSTWEVDTPYISRSSNHMMPVSSEITKVEVLKETDKKSHSEVKRKSSDSRRKKKRRRRSSSSSSSSSSESDDSSHKKETENDTLLNKKKAILCKVWALMEQKKKLDSQKADILMNNKANPKNLPSILEENSFLSNEIDKQIFVMNKMIQSINEELGVSLMDTHQQEFYMRSNLFGDDGGKAKKPAPKFPVIAQAEQISYVNKFLKPSDSTRLDDERKNKKLEQKYQKKAKEKLREEPEKKVKKELVKDSGRKMKTESRKVASTKGKPWQEIYNKTKEANKTKLQDNNSVNKKKPSPEKEYGPSKRKSSPDEEYAPSADMKPHVKYIDQGMHWCELCTEFLDSVNEYISHLQSPKHLCKLEKDKKKWLPKHTKSMKEKINKSAPLLTIPLQGVEFMHSLVGYYCSLCDLLIKSHDEAGEHAETKIHVSKYKDYLSKNPMYETTYIKDKMAAFAKYSVEKEKCKAKSENSDSFFSKRGETSPPLPKKMFVVKKQEIKPILPNIGKDLTSLVSIVTNEDPYSKTVCTDVTKVPIQMLSSTEVQETPNSRPKFQIPEETKFSSIRVASRASQPVENNNNLNPIMDKKDPTIECSNTLQDDSEKESNLSASIVKDDNKKLDTLRKIVGIPEGETSNKINKKNLSNIMIGKMPFLKRNRRELIITKDKPDLSTSNEPETEKTAESILPQVKPKNLQYITEIETLGKKTKFTKVIGPTQPDGSDSSDDDSDMEVDSNDSSSAIKSNPVILQKPEDKIEFNQTSITSTVEQPINATAVADQSYYQETASCMMGSVATGQGYYPPPVYNNYCVPPPCMPYQHPLTYMNSSMMYPPPMVGNYSSFPYDEPKPSTSWYVIKPERKQPQPPGTENTSCITITEEVKETSTSISDPSNTDGDFFTKSDITSQSLDDLSLNKDKQQYSGTNDNLIKDNIETMFPNVDNINITESNVDTYSSTLFNANINENVIETPSTHVDTFEATSEEDPSLVDNMNNIESTIEADFSEVDNMNTSESMIVVASHCVDNMNNTESVIEADTCCIDVTQDENTIEPENGSCIIESQTNFSNESEIVNSNVIAQDTLHGDSYNELTLTEAIVQKHNESLQLKQETVSIPAESDLSEELLKFEQVTNSQHIPNLELHEEESQSLMQCEDITTNQEFVSVEEDEQVLEGMQLLDGAESSDDSEE